MSFYSIKDPVERDKTIREYIDIKKRIKKRSMDERVGNVDCYRDLESHYEPIIKSQCVMREDIVHHLQPIRKGLVGVNEHRLVK
jgi:hypothetical protein